MSFSAYFDGRSRGVTWLVSRRLDASCALVLSDPAGRLCVLDVTIKDKAFRLIGVYGPNVTRKLPAFFRRIEPYVVPSKRVILVGDWNAVLDPNLDRGAISTGTNTLDARYFRDFVQRLDLVDKFRERHPNKIIWTWTGRGASAQLYSYLDRVLVKRVDLEYLGRGCPRGVWGCPRGVMVKAMNCGIVVREFVLQSRYYVHFRANTLGKGMNPLILPPAMDK